MDGEIPKTADELNKWINMNFSMFIGPSRAYFDLGEKRVTYISLGLIGPEEECCRKMFEVLRTIALTAPANTEHALFIRTKFEFDKWVEPGRLFGRLAFWRDDLNEALALSRVVKLGGGEFNRSARI